MAKIEVGKKAPEILLQRDDGSSSRLSDLRGRTVVLFFYPQDDTETCTKEALSFSGLQSAFDENGAIVIGISPDSAARHRRFREKHGLSVELASDVDRAAIAAYDVWVEKKTFGRTYMGVERSTFLIGADGKIRGIWRKVRVAGHAAEVLDAIKAL